MNINPFMPNGLFYLNSSERSISNNRGIWLVLLLPYFIEIPECIANSVDPDQTPRSAASDLDLQCFPMSLLWDSRLKWIKEMMEIQQFRSPSPN